MTAVYEELCKTARAYLQGERSGHTLQTDALVSETYLRLQEQKQLLPFEDRQQFFGLVAKQMRQILIGYARHRNADKNAGCKPHMYLDHITFELPNGKPIPIMAMEKALTDLEKIDPLKCCIVELHFFVGFSHEQVARQLDMKINQVRQQWEFAKAWLFTALSRE